MMKKLLYTFFALLPIVAAAQTNNKELNKQVEVSRAYEPTINDASKLNVMPKITDTLKLAPSFKYSIFSKPLESYFPVKPIPAAKLVAEPKPDLYDFYIRGGIGNYMSTLFDLYYNSPRNESYNYGIFVNHRASTGKVELENGPKVNTNNSKNQVGMFGKKIFDSAILTGGVSYTRSKNLFYGVDYGANPAYTFNKDSLTQYFNDVRVDLGLKSFYVDSSHINYRTFVAYDYFNDKAGFGENHINLGGEVFKFFQKDYLGLTADVLHIARSGELSDSSNTVVSLMPMLKKYGSFFTASIGVNFTNDSYSKVNKNYFFPVGHLTIDAAGNFFVPYVKVGGYLEVNSYKKMSSENPFITPGLFVDNTAHKMVLTGGIKGNVSASVSYNVWGGYELIDNQYFFVNVAGHKGLYNNFGVVYDNIRKTTFGGELGFSVKNYLEFNARAEVFNYSLDKQEKAWGMPSFEASVDARYKYDRKWKFSASVFAVGPRDAKSINPLLTAPVKLKSFVDVNLGCEYSFTSRLNAFVQVNNLLNTGYDIYYLYPAYKTNGMIGVSYSF